ncbi:TPA: hypothetical protein KQF34_002323 [Clostridioides difficile]|nr:hypothetical protein [Clostridioides difficile]
MINDFTYHIVNIKTLSDAAKGAKDTAFTYHLVNIKLIQSIADYLDVDIFTYHLVNITPTYIISFFTT